MSLPRTAKRVTLSATNVGILNLTQFPLPDPESSAARQIVVACRDLYAAMEDGSQSEAERRVDEMVWAAFGLPVEEV